MPEASKQLRRWSQRLRRYKRHRRTLIPKIAEILTNGTVQRMETATSPDGTPHAPLNAKYAAWKASHGYDTRIWHMTGAASKSVQVKVTEKGTVVVRIARPYASYVDKGTKTIPPRPVLGISKDEEEQIRKLIEETMEKTVSSDA